MQETIMPSSDKVIQTKLPEPTSRPLTLRIPTAGAMGTSLTTTTYSQVTTSSNVLFSPPPGPSLTTPSPCVSRTYKK